MTCLGGLSWEGPVCVVDGYCGCCDNGYRRSDLGSRPPEQCFSPGLCGPSPFGWVWGCVPKNQASGWGESQAPTPSRWLCQGGPP